MLLTGLVRRLPHGLRILFGYLLCLAAGFCLVLVPGTALELGGRFLYLVGLAGVLLGLGTVVLTDSWRSTLGAILGYCGGLGMLWAAGMPSGAGIAVGLVAGLLLATSGWLLWPLPARHSRKP